MAFGMQSFLENLGFLGNFLEGWGNPTVSVYADWVARCGTDD